MSEETLQNELLHTVKLDRKHRGELAELAFMRKAATFGFAVAKPWGDCDRYDVILRVGKIFWRVQVKSVWSKVQAGRARDYYSVRTTGASHRLYSADEIDFLVAYLFAEDLWYIFPVVEVANRTVLWLRPGSKKSRLEQYREAWKLMGATATNPAAADTPVSIV